MPSAEPDQWRNLDDFTYGMDANRRASTAALAGREWTLRIGEDAPVHEEFVDASTVREVDSAGTRTEHHYDAVEFAEGVFFIDLVRGDRPRESVTRIINPSTLRVLEIRSIIAEEEIPDQPRVKQSFRAGTVEDSANTPAGEAPAPTRELIGKRALYRYSPAHLYEHVYLNSARYAWQCLLGAQRGHGDVDLATFYKFDTDLYVVCWREFRIPVACVWAYNLAELHTTGKFFGLTGSGQISNSPAGAHIIMLPEASYPEGARPA